MDHQLTMLKIKSELFDIWTEESESHSYQQWFRALKPVLHRHFHINESDFFLYYNGSFIPLCGRDQSSEALMSIPIALEVNGKPISGSRLLAKFREREFGYANDYFLFRDQEDEPIGILIFKSTDSVRNFASSTYWIELEESICHLIQNVRKMYLLTKKEESYRQLFNVTEIFNSTMESAVILDGIVKAVSESFPTFIVDLLLSHEQRELTHHYQLFDYMNERPSALDAFLSGELTTEKASDLDANLINAPIKGRQGIYGVLQVKAPLNFDFSVMQKDFIRVVANTAGNALENASLYDQSHRLIDDLQLVNETSRKLNANLNFEEMVLFLKEQLLGAFKPSEIAFMFYGEDKHTISDVSSDFFRTAKSDRYIDYAIAHFATGKRELFDANFEETLQENVPYKSFIAVPITSRENIVGFVILLHTDRYSFPFDKFKLMRSLIGHSSLAFSNSMLRDQLQELVDKDHLTKLYTRIFMDKVIQKSFVEDEKGVFLMLDVDNFKKVNDTYGHAVGDTVLKDISSAILFEVGDEGYAARWGGEEIAIYFPDACCKKGADFSRRILSLIPAVTEPSVTVSIGMKSWSADSETTFQKLFQYADAALYDAKNTGKNRVVIHGATSAGV